MSSMAIPRCRNCGIVYDRPAPEIKWRGEAQSCFRRCPPPPGFGIANRVYSIARCFMPPVSDEEYSPEEVVEEELEDDKYDLEWKEGLLNELQLYVAESIDVTSILHSEGLLVPFLHHVLSNKHACIREKAAEVITTMVKNNPMSQQLVIEGNGLRPLLYNFSSDPDATSKTKALVAISALIRGNKSGGITAFQRESGYAALKNTLISESVCQRSAIYREVVNLLEYLLCENKLYHQAMDLQVADDLVVQEAALSGIFLLEERKGGNSGQLVKKKKKNRGSKKEKKQFKLEENEAPLTLGLGPSSAATPTVLGN